MKKSTLLLAFPALAVLAIGVFCLIPEEETPRRSAAHGNMPSSGTPDSRAVVLDLSAEWKTADRGSTAGRSPYAKNPPAGSVFAPRQALRTGYGSPAPAPASRWDGPLRPVGGAVLGDTTGFEVDPGIPIPASLTSIPPEIGLSELQMALSQQIATEFARKVDSSPDPSAAWPAERARADERFRLLFGDDLYRAQSVKVAREARGTSQP